MGENFSSARNLTRLPGACARLARQGLCPVFLRRRSHAWVGRFVLAAPGFGRLPDFRPSRLRTYGEAGIDSAVQGEVGVTKAAVTTRTDEHTLGIVLAGDITDAETADLRTMLVSAMKADADEVVVGLAAATALDSTAVGALLAAVEIAADQHVRFRIH